jgi:hypothetical protein
MWDCFDNSQWCSVMSDFSIQGQLITSIKWLKIYAFVVYQTAMKVVNAIANTPFARVKNECRRIAQEFYLILDHDAFIQPGMSEFPFVRDDLELSLKF